LNHSRRGSGQPLVLIHGIGSRLQVWAPVMEALSQRFDVIAADVPGFGQSPPLAGGAEPTVEALAGAFERFFEELGIPAPHVAGNSMGGGIALELARRDAARSATAISPIGFWTPRERRYSQLLLGLTQDTPAPLQRAGLAASSTAAGRVLLMSHVFARPWLVPPDVARETLVDFWGATSFKPALAAFDRYTFRNGHELRVPVTVLWGSRDRLLPYGRQAPRARDVLPQARHVTLVGLGHTPFYDDPELVAREMLAAIP
jgi:pimeloyl-ACP methyl ester carboxylesterase